MKLPSRLSILLLCCVLAAASAKVLAQDALQMQAPVSYASLSQLNSMLSQLEQTSQTTQLDLAKMRIDKWKTDAGTKKQTQGNTDSIQKNLHDALPEIIGQLRSSPEDLEITFKLYRNLSALYDVFSSVVESAGAFGSKDDFQSLDTDLSQLDQSRRSIGDRMDDLATAKDAEIKHLHTSLQAAQASIVTLKQQQKVVVSTDETPAKPKPVVRKKKPVAKPAGTAQPAGTTSNSKTNSTNSKPNPTTPANQQSQPNQQSH